MIKWVAIGLALFMAAMGLMKFVGDVPIFAIIEENLKAQYGISAPFIDPAFKYVTAVLELAAAGLLLLGQRRIGGLLSLAVIGGAIMAHLTVLGVATPVSSAPDAATSPMLFIIACVAFLVAGFVTVKANR